MSIRQRGLNPDKFKNGAATGYREPLLVRERERERAILRMYDVVVVVLAVDDDDTTMSLLCICFVYL